MVYMVHAQNFSSVNRRKPILQATVKVLQMTGQKLGVNFVWALRKSRHILEKCISRLVIVALSFVRLYI